MSILIYNKKQGQHNTQKSFKVIKKEKRKKNIFNIIFPVVVAVKNLDFR